MLKDFFMRTITRRSLERLSDRMLADIGISRSDIDWISRSHESNLRERRFHRHFI